MFYAYSNNKGPDVPAHPDNLIKAFVSGLAAKIKVIPNVSIS